MDLQRAALRQLAPLALVMGVLFLLRDRASAIDTDTVVSAFATVSPRQWVFALLATVLSFWALGRYDAVLHRHLGTHTSCRDARRAGIVAIAISQTVGLGIITGALVRWRMLRETSLWQATRITMVVAGSFLMGWAVVTAITILAMPLPGARYLTPIAMVAVLGALLGVVLSLWQPVLPFARTALRWPSLMTLGKVVGLVAVDTSAAAFALFMLMPAGSAPPFELLFPAYLIALGAGFVSGTPGGMVTFEVTLIALLPAAPTEPLLAAVLAYRVIYFALPALLGVAALAVGPRKTASSRADQHVLPALAITEPPLDRLIGLAQRAEVQIVRQGEHDFFVGPGGRAAWVVGQTSQALVGLFDTFGDRMDGAMLKGLRAEARRTGRVPALYKCGGRLAATARRAGFVVLPIAEEAWLRPATFDLADPALAQLRRKLRKAEKAGVTVSLAGPRLPNGRMTAIAEEWSTMRGGERGFSMGRFEPDYVAGQRVYLAYREGRLVAFATWHEGATEWVLDIMRAESGAPDGTMHALVIAALRDAAAAGLPRLSLAAIPADPETCETLPHRIGKRIAGRSGKRLAERLAARFDGGGKTKGLRQFKQCFAPRLETLYIAAPSHFALALTGLDIARRIHRPVPLGTLGRV